MRSVIITPRNKKEFDLAFTLLTEFGKERKRLTLDEDDDIYFAFLMKEIENSNEVTDKAMAKKPAR